MATITLKKNDYDETVYPAVAVHRPRNTNELSAAATLIPKLQKLGTHNGETYLMTEDQVTVELTGPEITLLVARLRDVVRRKPTSWAVGLVYLTEQLEAALSESRAVARVTALDDQIAERQAILRDLSARERQLSANIAKMEGA